MNSRGVIAGAAMLLSGAAVASEPLNYSAETFGGFSSGDFAPYYIVSNNFGVLTQAESAQLRVSAIKDLDYSAKFDYSFGADIIGGYESSVSYSRWRHDAFSDVERHPARIRLQQLFAQIKYRSVFLCAGLKETGSAMLDDRLSSGDITHSANARPMPEVRAGFCSFADIPFTGGLLQINGVLAFGFPSDSDWLRDHYNYYNSFITTGYRTSYKRVYFRTLPSARFSAVFGMQAASQFGGTRTAYKKGVATETSKAPDSFEDYLKNIIPHGEGGSGYYEGNHLGSWDFMATYRLNDGKLVKAYFQWPWEDGSGIGKLNGFDGLWGIEYKKSGTNGGIVTGAVIEYLDFTNQSGPLHWDPDDNSGTTITDQATGSDSYYNNYYYNGYAYYGLSQGTPMLRSPLYNRDGYMRFTDTRVKGFHIAVEGHISQRLAYRIMGGYRVSWGDSYRPRTSRVSDTSLMAECSWAVPKFDGLKVKAAAGADIGSMYGDCVGMMISIGYNGSLILKKQ